MSILVTNVSRRDVLKTLGLASGFVLSTSILPRGLRAMVLGNAEDPVLSPSVYLAIDEDGTVRVYVHRVEMGQGTRTGLAQIIADELDADWNRLQVMPAYGDKKFGSQNTDGSSSIRGFYDAFRTAGATARTMLEQAAARQWGADSEQVEASMHEVLNKVTGATLDYRELVAAAAQLPVPPPESLKFKPRSEHTYIGKPIPNIYGEDMATGRAMFGQDVRREGMVYAVAQRPPDVGGMLDSYDKAAAMAVPGVLDVVELPAYTFPMGFHPLGGVAVVATNTWAAMQGREALNATFKPGPNADYDTTKFEASLWQSIEDGGQETYARGDVAADLASSSKRLSADYFVPHQHHIPMEPPAATAEWNGDNLKIWTSCQDPQAVQETVAPFVGKKPEEIYVEATLLGGAFGRKSKPDFAVEAAVLAKHMGKPVKMIWTREDDVKHGFYHTIAAQRVDVGLDASGKVTAWDHRAAYPSLMEVAGAGRTDAAAAGEVALVMQQPFGVPSMRIRSGEAPAHVRVGWMRSVTSIQHSFAVGSMVDEIAAETGRRPDEVWNDLFGSVLTGAEVKDRKRREPRPADAARLKAVFARVVQTSGYGRKLPARTGIGLAAWASFGSFTAAALEVTVSPEGDVKVPRAWTAIDCGLAVNPDRTRAQIEGATIFGLSIALHGEITAENGAIVQNNFNDYPVCRMPEAPEVEVSIFENDYPLGGVGEPGVPPVAPALCNGIFAAVGKRIRRLPLKNQLRQT